MNVTAKIVFAAALVYLTAAGISYTIFSRLAQNQTQKNASSPTAPKKLGDAVQFDNSLPKTEPCPLNGVLYSTQQRQWWEKRSPLAVMIENHVDARPQSGISFADVTYEALVEGGITRTMNVYYCQDAGQVGPVRSARTYFLDYASEYGNYPLYAHVGGANTPGPANALGQIEDYGWAGYNDLNQFSIGYPVFWRDYDRLGRAVATEHTMYSTTTKLWDYAAKNRNITNVYKDGTPWTQGFVPYRFKDDPAVSKRPASQQISFTFTGNYNEYGVKWTYDKTANLYFRENGGAPHIDRDTGKQLSAKSVIVLYEPESRANDGYEGNQHLLYATKGSGKAIIFMDGQQISGTWSKASRTARTKIYNANGQEMQFSRGKMWFEILGKGNDISVK